MPSIAFIYMVIERKGKHTWERNKGLRTIPPEVKLTPRKTDTL
jgi:hypothetical protein